MEWRIMIGILIGISAGILVACGLCALITTVGIITRIAWRTKTVDRLTIYENTMIGGAVIAVFVYLAMPDLALSYGLAVVALAVTGFFTGVFVGCLAMSLTEALDASAILFRRIQFRGDTRYVLMAAALGKFVGNWIYFMRV